MGNENDIILFEPDIKRLENIKLFILENLNSELNLSSLSAKFGTGKSTLRRHFIHHFHISLHDFILETRMSKAMGMLINHSLSIGQIGIEVGYTDRSAFTRAFTKFFNHPPFYFLRINH